MLGVWGLCFGIGCSGLQLRAPAHSDLPPPTTLPSCSSKNPQCPSRSHPNAQESCARLSSPATTRTTLATEGIGEPPLESVPLQHLVWGLPATSQDYSGPLNPQKMFLSSTPRNSQCTPGALQQPQPGACSPLTLLLYQGVKPISPPKKGLFPHADGRAVPGAGGKVEPMPTATAGFASTLIKGLSEFLACAPQHPKARGPRWCDDPPLQVWLGGLSIPGMANPTLITGCSPVWPATPNLLARGQPLWLRVSPQSSSPHFRGKSSQKNAQETPFLSFFINCLLVILWGIWGCVLPPD